MYIGLRQLHTKQFCMQLMKAYIYGQSCELINSAASLLTIYSPILNNVTMSLYDKEIYISREESVRVDQNGIAF